MFTVAATTTSPAALTQWTVHTQVVRHLPKPGPSAPESAGRELIEPQCFIARFKNIAALRPNIVSLDEVEWLIKGNEFRWAYLVQEVLAIVI